MVFQQGDLVCGPLTGYGGYLGLHGDIWGLKLRGLNDEKSGESHEKT